MHLSAYKPTGGSRLVHLCHDMSSAANSWRQDKIAVFHAFPSHHRTAVSLHGRLHKRCPPMFMPCNRSFQL